MAETLEVGHLRTEEIEEIAQALLAKIEQEGWGWEIEYHPDDSEFGAASYWDITGTHGESNMKLSMILGRVPWITRIRLSFTVDGESYTCEEELFERQPFRAIMVKLDEIGRGIRDREIQETSKTHTVRIEDLDNSRRERVASLTDKLKR